MRTKAWQTFIILATIGGIAAVAVCLTALSSPFLKMLLGDFYVPADMFLWLLLFMFLSAVGYGIVVRMLPVPLGRETDLLSKEGFFYKFQGMLYEIGFLTWRPLITPFLLVVWYRMFGARIGKGCIVHSLFGEPYLITVGEYAILGRDSLLLTHIITYGRFELSPIVIGDQVTVGANTTIMPGVEIGEGSVVAGDAVVVRDTKIPPHELWGGIPARKIKDIPSVT